MATKCRPTVVRATGFLSNDHREADTILRKIIETEFTPSEREKQKYKVIIVPSCVEGTYPTALIDFEHGLPTFLLELKDNPVGEWQIEIDSADEYLSFDRHFHGFTQLYMVEPRSITTE